MYMDFSLSMMYHSLLVHLFIHDIKRGQAKIIKRCIETSLKRSDRSILIINSYIYIDSLLWLLNVPHLLKILPLLQVSCLLFQWEHCEVSSCGRTPSSTSTNVSDNNLSERVLELENVFLCTSDQWLVRASNQWKSTASRRLSVRFSLVGRLATWHYSYCNFHAHMTWCIIIIQLTEYVVYNL